MYAVAHFQFARLLGHRDTRAHIHNGDEKFQEASMKLLDIGSGYEVYEEKVNMR